MLKPKITIYIPSHNYGKYLQEAVESVLRQSVDNWELFLINENSTDNTREIMDLYTGDPRVQIFDTPNLGLPGVANFVLKRSQGEYLIRLDADDVFDENILLVLGHYLDRNTDAALVFPDYFLVDDLGGVIHYEGRQTIYDNNHLLDMPAHGACTMIRKTILQKLGGYREDLGSQDGFDLWTKVVNEFKCANVNIPLFYYRRHGQNLTDNTVRILSARRTIKKDACNLNLDQFRPITAVIPCREFYDVYPNLWSQKINGKALLEISIEACLASALFDKIVVTADTPAVNDIMQKYHDPRLTYLKRSQQSTTISRSISETLNHVIRSLELGWNGICVLSYIQAPFVTTATLEEAVYTLVMHNADSSFAVEEVKEHLYSRTAHGLTPVHRQGRIKSDFDIIYQASRSSTATKNINLKTGSLTGAKVSHFIVSKQEAFFIQSKADLKMAEILQNETLVKEDSGIKETVND